MKVYVAWWGTFDDVELIGAASSLARAQQIADDWWRAYVERTGYMQDEPQWLYLTGEWAQRKDDATCWNRLASQVSSLYVNEMDVVQDQEGT
jgi:hypothetical protein